MNNSGEPIIVSENIVEWVALHVEHAFLLASKLLSCFFVVVVVVTCLVLVVIAFRKSYDNIFLQPVTNKYLF